MKLHPFLYRHAGLGSLFATITNAIAVFVVFRFAYGLLGPSVMGMWALIQGIMLISRLSDMGSSGNITRLVAIERSSHASFKLRNFLYTGWLVSTAPIGVLGLILAIPTFYYAKLQYHVVMPDRDLAILIWSSLAFGVLSSAGSVLSGCLDGLGLMALRGYLSALANILFVFLAYLLIRDWGDAGLGLAYVLYAALLMLFLFGGILVFRMAAGDEGRERSIGELVRSSFMFNANFLVIGVCRLLLDPTSKILIGAFTTLDYVAIFDLANKITTQARILYSSALQQVLPMVSRETRDLDAGLLRKLDNWTWLATRWSLYSMSIAVLASGFLSALALGRVRPEFVWLFFAMSFGNAVNAMGLVGYYVEVGSGHLRRLVLIHIGMACSNAVLGAAGGYVFGAAGITLAFAGALAWAGIACSRQILGSFRSAIAAMLRQIPFELATFGFSGAATWLALYRLPAAMRLEAAGVAALLVVVAFAVREWPLLAAQYARRTQSRAARNDTAKLDSL